MTYEPYVYKTKKKRRQDDRKSRLKRSFGKEVLSGYIGDNAVSPIEERFARGLRTNNIGFIHQFPVRVMTSRPGEKKFVDFLVGRMQTPTEVLGEIGHASTADRGKDKWREDQINQELMPKGHPQMVEVWWYELETQKQADRIVQELFG